MNGSTQNFVKSPQTNTTAVLNLDEENEIQITGYRLVKWKWFLTIIAMVFSAGLLWLLLYWNPKWQLWFTHKIVSLDLADTVMIEDEYKKDYKRYYVEKIMILSFCEKHKKIPLLMPKQNEPSEMIEVSKIRYFNCKKETYLWNDMTQNFFLCQGLDQHIFCEQFYEQIGLTENEQAKLRLVYGTNDILVPNHSYSYLLVTEVLNPFYIFQVASVILWSSDEYYYYAAAIGIFKYIQFLKFNFKSGKIRPDSGKITKYDLLVLGAGHAQL